jgi:hypothetical protein
MDDQSTTVYVVVGWDQCSKSLIKAFYDETDAIKYCMQCNKKPPKFAWHKTFMVESVDVK